MLVSLLGESQLTCYRGNGMAEHNCGFHILLISACRLRIPLQSGRER